MKQTSLFKLNEFVTYFIIGGIATGIDWSTFWILTRQFSVHYQISLIGCYFTAGIFHYLANKFLTFGCQSKKLGSQFSLYLLVTITSLMCSMGVMSIVVNYITADKLYGRMITTILMLIPNYLFHKYITFNKKIFLQPEAN